MRKVKKNMTSKTIAVEFPVPDFSESLYQKAMESVEGRCWKMADLRDWTGGKKEEWIKNYIIDNPRFSREINKMEKSGQIIVSKGNGSPWRFKATAMAEFLERHFEELPWDKSK